MVELNPRDNFDRHLEELLTTVDNEDLRTLLREHTDTILQCSGGSERVQRAPIREALSELVNRQPHVEDEDES